MPTLKKCTCCNKPITRAEWTRLPAARGGLRAMGMEWRNCADCGSKLALKVAVLEAA